MEVFQLINEEGVVVLGYHHFITPTDVGNEHQWLLSSKKKEIQADIICFLMEVHNPIYEVFL